MVRTNELAIGLQGDDTIHNTIRSMQLQIGVPKAIARALRRWGSSSDEVCLASAQQFICKHCLGGRHGPGPIVMRIGHDRHGTQEAIGLSLVSWRITVNSVSFELNLRGSRCWCCKLMRRGVTQQVIWAALFALAVLVRGGSTPHSPALRAIAACGMLPILNACMSDYKVQLHTANVGSSLPAEHKG